MPEFYGACKSSNQTKGYYQQTDWTHPTAAWTFKPVTGMVTFPFGGTGWMHGMGFGDVNGDGKTDLLERSGAWLQIGAGSWNATVCPATGCGMIAVNLYDGLTDAVGNKGGSHMFAADFDGDGDADIFSADWAHGFGLAWYEQTAGQTFVKHQITATVTFSEPHAVEVVDMDGDGVPDIVTGKTHFAHPLAQNDPDPNGTPYVVIFKGVRDTPGVSGAMHFELHVVDSVVGVGWQIGVGHLNTDGIMDFCVASKLGIYAFIGQ
jgi:hypothetical protein